MAGLRDFELIHRSAVRVFHIDRYIDGIFVDFPDGKIQFDRFAGFDILQNFEFFAEEFALCLFFPFSAGNQLFQIDGCDFEVFYSFIGLIGEHEFPEIELAFLTVLFLNIQAALNAGHTGARETLKFQRTASACDDFTVFKGNSGNIRQQICTDGDSRRTGISIVDQAVFEQDLHCIFLKIAQNDGIGFCGIHPAVFKDDISFYGCCTARAEHHIDSVSGQPAVAESYGKRLCLCRQQVQIKQNADRIILEFTVADLTACDPFIRFIRLEINARHGRGSRRIAEFTVTDFQSVHADDTDPLAVMIRGCYLFDNDIPASPHPGRCADIDTVTAA